MSLKFKKEKFINVVGTVNLEEKTGSILYVNPAGAGLEGTEAGGDGRATLVLEDDDGNELVRALPAIRQDSCDCESEEGLIQHDLPYAAGGRTLRLLLDGEEIARYDAPQKTQAPAEAGMSFAPSSAKKRLVDLAGIDSEPGVSYTVMIQPEGEAEWSAAGVGMEQPAFELDSNQFPGKQRLKVRVLQSTGFEETIIAEEDINLENMK